MHGYPLMAPDLAEQILLTFGAGMLGASVGSFVNVCIYRWPRGLSVGEPKRSFCPCCKEAIRALDNIPVLSWLLLRGRCRRCRAAIPISYFLVELFSGLGAALAFSKYGWIAAVCFIVQFGLLCTLLRSSSDRSAVRPGSLILFATATFALLAAQRWHGALSYPLETLFLGLIIGIWIGGQRQAGWLLCLVCVCAGFAAGPVAMALAVCVLGGLNLWFARSARFALYVDCALLLAVCLEPLFL
jgi:prepilin signal peptidase PulO-like enzyme (type II secretory pathway)